MFETDNLLLSSDIHICIYVCVRVRVCFAGNRLVTL